MEKEELFFKMEKEELFSKWKTKNDFNNCFENRFLVISLGRLKMLHNVKNAHFSSMQS